MTLVVFSLGFLLEMLFQPSNKTLIQKSGLQNIITCCVLYSITPECTYFMSIKYYKNKV
jgi:hypothetical protein